MQRIHSAIPNSAQHSSTETQPTKEKQSKEPKQETKQSTTATANATTNTTADRPKSVRQETVDEAAMMAVGGYQGI